MGLNRIISGDKTCPARRIYVLKKWISKVELSKNTIYTPVFIPLHAVYLSSGGCHRCAGPTCCCSASHAASPTFLCNSPTN